MSFRHLQTFLPLKFELAYEDKREFFLKNAIDMIKESFDYIIIDSPPALGMITINIILRQIPY